ncbi:ricin B-like lectin R40G3 [Forsythia ovata]|uniref:Ricin B-like lectin R40G3 n=1 Tax=Forsythia ovata TaxID=205694 RepID=A0ABD1T5I1_9LAMI
MEYPHGHPHRHHSRDKIEDEYPPPARPPPPLFYEEKSTTAFLLLGKMRHRLPSTGKIRNRFPITGKTSHRFLRHHKSPMFIKTPIQGGQRIICLHQLSLIKVENNPHHHQHHSHFPSIVHHHSHEKSEFTNKPSVRVYSKAETNYSLTIRVGKVILSPSNLSDLFQTVGVEIPA